MPAPGPERMFPDLGTRASAMARYGSGTEGMADRCLESALPAPLAPGPCQAPYKSKWISR